MSNISKKLTLSSMKLSKTEVRAALNSKEDKESVAIAQVAGRTTGAEPKQTDYGESIKLKGNFTGINLLTGEIFESGIAYIPDFVATPLAAALEGTDAVEFAIEIMAVKRDDLAIGYSYDVRSLIETKPSNSMQHLLEKAGMSTPLALSAPMTADETNVAPIAKSKKRA